MNIRRDADSMTSFPASIAIAGAWGYIGRKVLEAALRHGVRTFVYDPGEAPADVDLGVVTRLDDEEEFYRLSPDFFHLALHPDARDRAQQALLQRARSEPLAILNEKPMAAPEHPKECPRLVAAVGCTRALMLYDFTELFDPLTHCIVDYLTGFDQVEISSIVLRRCKDREDPALPRNYKVMVPIQYQESVHCLAFILYLLATLRGGFAAALSEGVSVTARSAHYHPPNPEAYPYVVDGRCEYALSIGALAVDGLTDFTRGAPWTKRRVLRGRADGRPFCIEADYLEGAKFLRINGVDQGYNAATSSYDAILSTFTAWQRTTPVEDLMQGVFPNPHLAWWAYQLSSVLWRSSHEGTRIELAGSEELKRFDAGFAAACRRFPRYSDGGTADHAG